MRTVSILAAILAFAIPSFSQDDLESILLSLTQAKGKYNRENERLRNTIVEDLNSREAKARELGDKKAVDQIKAEREAFEALNQMPKSFSNRIYNTQMQANRASMLKAFRTAIKDYTKKGLDHKADAVEGELVAFLSNLGPTQEQKVEDLPQLLQDRIALVTKISGTKWTWDEGQKVRFLKDGKVVAEPTGREGTWAAIDKNRIVIAWPTNGTTSVDIVEFNDAATTIHKKWLGGLADKKNQTEKLISK